MDYEAWTNRAASAEQVIEAGRASSAALEELRLAIADWRQRFLDAQDLSTARIATLQSQLDALGPVPEDGGEPTEIADRRAELNEQLTRARAPVLRAEEAYTRADGLIGEIDSIIRSRQTNALLELGPSPVNPALWPQAIETLAESTYNFIDEVTRNFASDALRAEARANLPLVLGLLALAFVLLMRGQSWVRGVVDNMRERTRRGTGVWSFGISLGQIVLPLAGIYALTEALFATGMLGVRTTLLLESVPLWAGVLLGIRWLADQVFHPDDRVAALPIAPARRTEARYYVNIITLLLVIWDVLDVPMTFDNYPPATAAVLGFPILVLAGLMLFRMGQILSKAEMESNEAVDAAYDGEQPNFRFRMSRLLGRAAMLIAVIGPVMSAIGYGLVGEALVFPAIQTLALAGLVLVLQRFVNDLYRLITGRSPHAAESLVPVLAGFALTLSSLPLLALIWGARVADLTELWARAREGFAIGDTRIAPQDFIVAILFFAIGYMLTRLLQGGLKTSVLPKTKIDQGGQNAIVAGVGYVGIFLAAVVGITAGGIDLSSIALVAGALSVGIGFGLQNIVSNFVSGIILLIERPISEGDWIEVNGTHGTVKDISVRSTRIETFDRYDVIIPNGDLVSGTVSNYTRGNVLGRIMIPVGVAYGSDTRKVERVLLGIAREHEMVLMNPAPAVDFVGFGADSLDFRIRAVLRDINYGLGVRTEMRHQIVERFAEEGIEIPFAQRDIWLRNPEALTGMAKPDGGKEDDAEQGGSA
ncbi:MAG: DUF3772 domain-containing protein [Paracoccaceae bacterium]|nr:DUF3772 domain-containing protein [Paracoccaceae bacterium]